MSTLQVAYVGLKPQETDCVAGTGITWVGKGDVQTVPAKAWDIMKNHPDVWELVDQTATGGLAEAKSTAPAETTDPVVDDWLTKTPEQLHAYADARNIKVDKRLKDADKIRAVIDAATPKA